MRAIRVDDIMTRDVFAVGPSTDLETVAALFVAKHISGTPVIDAKGRAVGMISKTDLLAPRPERSATTPEPLYYRVRGGEIHTIGTPLDGRGAIQAVAGDVMSPFVFCVGPKAPISDAMRLMVMDEVHRLLVVDGDRIVGILTSMDLLRALLDWAGLSTATGPGETGER